MKSLLILISTYNGEKFLEKQLESIKNQKLPNDLDIRIYARDDGSKDGTIRILQEWKKELNIEIIKGENIGARKSFYWLLMNTPRADYYAFCDQDDIWKLDKIEKAISTIQSGYDMYFSNVEYIDENDCPLGSNLLRNDFSLSLRRIFMCNPANGCTMMWNNKIHEMLKEIEYKTFTMHDEFVCTIASIFGKVYYDSEASMFYRVHASNVTQSDSIQKKYKLWKEIWFGRKQYSLDKRANTLLEYSINDDDKRVLQEISTYRRGINRFRLLHKYNCEDFGIERSFKLRMILGLL